MTVSTVHVWPRGCCTHHDARAKARAAMHHAADGKACGGAHRRGAGAADAGAALLLHIGRRLLRRRCIVLLLC